MLDLQSSTSQFRIHCELCHFLYGNYSFVQLLFFSSSFIDTKLLGCNFSVNSLPLLGSISEVVDLFSDVIATMDESVSLVLKGVLNDSCVFNKAWNLTLISRHLRFNTALFLDSIVPMTLRCLTKFSCCRC